MSNKTLDVTKRNPDNEFRPEQSKTAFRVKKWKPVYDMIVAGHIMGKKNVELATEFDVTTVTISNILRSEHAQRLIHDAHMNIRENIHSHVEETTDIQARIKQKTLERVEEFLDKGILAENTPFAYMDRILKLGGVTNPTPVSAPAPSITINNQQNQAIVEKTELKTESINRLAKAIELSNG